MKTLNTLLFIICLSANLFSQATENFRVICYNVENYFDCIDDSLTNDAEYLPGGVRGWTNTKFKQKQMNIAKVITAIGGWETVGLIGLCEIENRNCLLGLTKYDALKGFNYQFLHHESPDARGVDVALLYDRKQFEPLYDEAITVHFPFHNSTTRDILYTKGLVKKTDTLHVFLAHFPSRLGGELESEPRRTFIASLIRNKIDSIFLSVPNANILIMGDFNDYPSNKSVAEVIGACPLTEMPAATKMYNMMSYFEHRNEGTHKFQGEWGCLDQIIVSENLLNPLSPIYTTQEHTHLFNPDWLLEPDNTHLGKQPFRTYIGFKYNGGFSDHLPIYIDLKISVSSK